MTLPLLLQQGAWATPHLLSPLFESYSQLVVLSHPSLLSGCAQPLLSFLRTLGRPLVEIAVPEGESSKSLTMAKKCWKEMLQAHIDRKAALLAVGGGVITDLGGFVASCYMRGIDTFYFPTTLLAMVDAAIGGKTAVNFQGVKNIVGTFHCPRAVVIDPSVLSTLPPRELRAAFAEIIKAAVIADPDLFCLLEEKIEEALSLQEPLLSQLIVKSIAIKQSIVEKDEKETSGLREQLNLGHTFAHAIESATKYTSLLHGEAVSIGISCAAHFSYSIGLSDSSLPKKIDALLLAAGLPIHLPKLSLLTLIQAMSKDKKSCSGKINLILPKRIGKVVGVCDVDSLAIKQFLQERWMN